MSGGISGMDIRLPMGLMFVIIGLLIMFYGMATMNNKMYEASDGININLVWGAVLAGFGVLMLVLTWIARPKKA